MPGVLNWVLFQDEWVPVKATAEGAIYIVEGHRDVIQVRITDPGLVIAGHYHIQWLTLNPSGINNLIEFTDDEDGEGDVVWDFYRAEWEAQHINFRPTFHFGNGIYIKTLTAYTSIIMGYEPG